MSRVRTRPKRIALPKDAVHMVELPTNEHNSPSRTPIKLWECFEDWLEGTSFDIIADRLNVTMREMDEILRQLVVEKIANVQRKSHARNTARKEQKTRQNREVHKPQISRTSEANINRELEKTFKSARTED